MTEVDKISVDDASTKIVRKFLIKLDRLSVDDILDTIQYPYLIVERNRLLLQCLYSMIVTYSVYLIELSAKLIVSFVLEKKVDDHA